LAGSALLPALAEPYTSLAERETSRAAAADAAAW
jgi:hypothetical protein